MRISFLVSPYISVGAYLLIHGHVDKKNSPAGSWVIFGSISGVAEEETTEEPWTGQAETLFVPFALACTVPAGLHSTCLGVNIHGWY